MIEEKIYPMSLQEFMLFKELMNEETGISFSESKQNLMTGRLKKRLIFHHLDTFAQYYKMVKNNQSERQICIDLLTTNETFFFRHKNMWDLIRDTFIPQWLEKKQPISIWSAASSSGEEAYSCAILLHNTIKRQLAITIEGSDISQSVLQTARQGTYTHYALQKLTQSGKDSYFTYDIMTDMYQLKKYIRDMVQFTYHNLLNAKIGKKFDLIFLRNVLIYFNSDKKKAVLQNITNALKPEGILMLGGSESLSHFREQYTQLQSSVYRKKNG